MILSRYLTREIVNVLFIIMTVLMLAFISQQVVRYLNYVAIGKIPGSAFLYLISFEIPYLLALLLPLALYLSILFTYGRFYTDHELPMMLMGGFRYGQLVRLTSFIAAGVGCIVLFLMLWVNPLISAKRQEMMTGRDATLHLIRTLSPGRFQTSLNDRHVMYVEKLSRDHERAENIFLAEEIKPKEDKENKENKENKWVLFSAREGYETEDTLTKDALFVMLNGFRYEGVPGQSDYHITQFKKYSIRIPQADVRTNHSEVELQSTGSLWRNSASLKEAAELQWRFSVGISAFLMGLLALPLSHLRPRQGRYLIFLPAVLIYILYIDLLIAARHWLEQGVVPIWLGMWWVHCLLMGVIIFAFWNNKMNKLSKSS